MKSLGEKIEEADIVSKLLRSICGKFDLIISYIEQFQNLDYSPLMKLLDP